jgi:HicA toxin of bacterial toxin-antitoxin,
MRHPDGRAVVVPVHAGRDIGKGTLRNILAIIGMAMVLIPDEGPAEERAPAPADPTFCDGVHARRPDVAEHGPDSGIGEDGVECGSKVRAAVPDHELDPLRLLAEVHQQVLGLLRGPLPGGMQSDPEDADAPDGVLDHSQDVSLGAVEQIDREEVARQDRLGLGAQEQGPG